MSCLQFFFFFTSWRPILFVNSCTLFNIHHFLLLAYFRISKLVLWQCMRKTNLQGIKIIWYTNTGDLSGQVTHTIISEIYFTEIHFCHSFVYVFLNCHFLQAYVSILYMGLPKHFRIILRGQEVKRRNLVTELKDSQYIRYRRSTTERGDEVVCPSFF